MFIFLFFAISWFAIAKHVTGQKDTSSVSARVYGCG